LYLQMLRNVSFLALGVWCAVSLREFDRFLVGSARKRVPLDQAALEWLSIKPGGRL